MDHSDAKTALFKIAIYYLPHRIYAIMITANPSADGEKMKQIANMITACRIAAAVALIFIAPFTAWLYAAYILGGITDMIGRLQENFRAIVDLEKCLTAQQILFSWQFVR